MTYFTDLNIYLHQSSLLIQAYPSTRITTKYSLPRKPTPSSATSKSKRAVKPTATSTSTPSRTDSPGPGQQSASSKREPKEPAATLTLKTFHPESGICLKYQTDKAQEVGRLLNGLGRLAKGEVIEMPSVGAPTLGNVGAVEDKMDVDVAPSTGAAAVEKAASTSTQQQQQQQQQQQSSGAGGAKKKKKGGKK